jgi:hypothetical protein
MMRSVISFLILLNSNYIVSALRNYVNKHLAWNEYIQMSERYMFSSQNGPAIMEQGESYIELDTSVVISMKVNKTSRVKYAIYTCDQIDSNNELLGKCDNELLERNPWIDNVSLFRLHYTIVFCNLRTVKHQNLLHNYSKIVFSD